jgi:hypothetical protein
MWPHAARRAHFKAIHQVQTISFDYTRTTDSTGRIKTSKLRATSRQEARRMVDEMNRLEPKSEFGKQEYFFRLKPQCPDLSW